MHRLVTSGRREEPVNIDFISRFGGPIPCLVAEQDDNDYQTILAIVPGDILMDVYGEYGSRLLQLNVRSFLQARGKVNQGIRRTILNEPVMGGGDGGDSSWGTVLMWKARVTRSEVLERNANRLVIGG